MKATTWATKNTLLISLGLTVVSSVVVYLLTRRKETAPTNATPLPYAPYLPDTGGIVGPGGVVGPWASDYP